MPHFMNYIYKSLCLCAKVERKSREEDSIGKWKGSDTNTCTGPSDIQCWLVRVQQRDSSPQRSGQVLSEAEMSELAAEMGH